MRLFIVFFIGAANYLTQSNPVIVSPRPGDVLLGTIQITGTTDIPNFAAYQLEFAYVNDPTQTWFLISQSEKPVRNGSLAIWDTAVITDGEYDLRLRIFSDSGSYLEVIVSDLRVRNYTPIETLLPPPISVNTQTYPAVTPSLLIPTSTLHTPNAASLTHSLIFTGFGYGALAALAILFAIFIYNHVRKK
jgi:hypothetical protein